MYKTIYVPVDNSELSNQAIANGIVAYFAENPPPGTLFAERQRVERPDDLEYVIARGDTLSEIADRFNVSLTLLRNASRILVEQVRTSDAVGRVSGDRAAADVSRQTINAIEKGKFDPSLPLAFKAARLFDMAIEDIFEDEA